MKYEALKTKSLFTVKGVKIAPLISVVYGVLAVFVVLPLLFFVSTSTVFNFFIYTLF